MMDSGQTTQEAPPTPERDPQLPATIKAFASLLLAIAAVLTAGGLVGWQAAIVVIVVLAVLLLLAGTFLAR
jgi:fatty acid desaturase